jgi:putative transcriptional regulator
MMNRLGTAVARAGRNQPIWLIVLLLFVVVAGEDRIVPAASHEPFLVGQLLIATPEMQDPRFAEAVIYMVKHDDNGAFGLIINKPIAKGSFADLLKGFGMDSKGAKGEAVVHYGGPVNTSQGFILHSDDLLLESSTKVKDGIAMTADAKMVQAMAQGKGPRQSLLMLGYAGWGPRQLEMEISANSWFTINGDKTLVFGKDPDKKWRQAMDKRQIPL